MENSIDFGTQRLDITQVDDEHQRDLAPIIASIKEMVHKLPPITSECSIFRVSNTLRSINPLAYTPQVISIGPYHHGKDDLIAMEQLKLRFFYSYLRRIRKDVEDVFKKAQKWERRAREHYAEPINMKSEEFVKMMLVDGCFIVEFMMINYFTRRGSDNPLSDSLCDAVSADLHRDLILLENQLPFFVLVGCLFDQFSQETFVECAHSFLDRWFTSGKSMPSPPVINGELTELNHLVDLFSFYYVVSFDNDSGNSSWKYPINHPTATELWEAGVKFRTPNVEKHIMDISFHNGVLEIPPFKIRDTFETSMRNLMAFEHYHAKGNKRDAIQYVLFMDELINTERDVSLLVEAKIITNNIGGNDEEIVKLFNHLCKGISDTFEFNYYGKINEDLHEHCRVRWNKWKTILKRDYFNTPWAIISFIAASILILFTVLQFIFSILQGSK